MSDDSTKNSDFTVEIKVEPNDEVGDTEDIFDPDIEMKYEIESDVEDRFICFECEDFYEFTTSEELECHRAEFHYKSTRTVAVSSTDLDQCPSLREFDKSGKRLSKECLEKHFMDEKLTLLHFMVLAISMFPKNIIQWYKVQNCFIFSNPVLISKLWGLASFCSSLRLDINQEKYSRERKIARSMDYQAFTKAARNYSIMPDMLMSTKTSDPEKSGNADKNGIPKVWGFTRAFLGLVGFDQHYSDSTLLEAVELKMASSSMKMRPLLKQIRDGLQMDRDLCVKYGFKHVIEDLGLSQQLLIECKLIDETMPKVIQVNSSPPPEKCSSKNSSLVITPSPLSGKKPTTKSYIIKKAPDNFSSSLPSLKLSGPAILVEDGGIKRLVVDQTNVRHFLDPGNDESSNKQVRIQKKSVSLAPKNSEVIIDPLKHSETRNPLESCYQKPPLSYCCLGTLALMNSKSGRLTVSQVSQLFVYNFK